MNKIVTLLMHVQTKLNDELEMMIKDEYYGPSQFTLEGHDVQFLITWRH